MAKDFTDADRQAMDHAAVDAENDLMALPDEALAAVAGWWKKWYPGAGHKRLARILLQYAPKKD